MTDGLLRRAGVYGRCVRHGSILLTRLSERDPDGGRWTLPGGGMEFGETPHETLTREFREETGLVPDIGRLLMATSRVHPPRPPRGPLQVLHFVYSVTAAGVPEVLEVDGSTAEAAWIPLDRVVMLPLLAPAEWAVTT